MFILPEWMQGVEGEVMNEIRDKLIAAGVKNLQEFGYPSCNKDNILTDYVFSRFFLSMLGENKGHGKDIDAAIGELIAQCGQKEKKDEKGRLENNSVPRRRNLKHKGA